MTRGIRLTAGEAVGRRKKIANIVVEPANGSSIALEDGAEQEDEQVDRDQPEQDSQENS